MKMKHIATLKHSHCTIKILSKLFRFIAYPGNQNVQIKSCCNRVITT